MPNPKLSEEDVQTLRREFPNAGLTMRQWARQFGVTRECIWRVLHKRSWKAVQQVSERTLINQAFRRWGNALRA